MIIMDMNQVMIANMMASLGSKTAEIDEGLFRHMVLNTIRLNLVKFKKDYGALVIACDNKNVWRKQVFPYYKAHRKIDREASPIDWNAIFQMINKVREELKEYFPYRVIDIETAEADDVIATLCERFGVQLGSGQEKIMILSGDKDFAQLQKYSNVEQYDPVRKKSLRVDNPEQILKEHILKGDRGDGVPNALSPDDIFITGGRQKPLTQKKIDAILSGAQELSTECQRYYERNRIMIDLTCIPSSLKEKINHSFDEQNGKGREKLFNYFVEYKLKNLMEDVGDF